MTLTLLQARKVLGKIARNVPDEILLEDIEVAELFKNIYFDLLQKLGSEVIKERGKF